MHTQTCIIKSHADTDAHRVTHTHTHAQMTTDNPPPHTRAQITSDNPCSELMHLRSDFGSTGLWSRGYKSVLVWTATSVNPAYLACSSGVSGRPSHVSTGWDWKTYLLHCSLKIHDKNKKKDTPPPKKKTSPNKSPMLCTICTMYVLSML